MKRKTQRNNIGIRMKGQKKTTKKELKSNSRSAKVNEWSMNTKKLQKGKRELRKWKCKENESMCEKLKGTKMWRWKDKWETRIS